MTTTFRDETKVLTIEILKGKDYPQWVCAAQPGIKLSDGTIADGKEPINPKTGGNAMADIPGTWASFERAYKRWQSEPERILGIGYELLEEQGITCVDLDKCIDENGELKPWARKIVDTLNSYTEYSPSRLGLHIWVIGNIPSLIPADTDGLVRVEMYDHGHYMTITENHFDGTPGTIENRQGEILILHMEVTKQRKQAAAAKKEARRKAKGQVTTGQQQEIKGTTNDTRYGLKALQDECNILASTTEGSRNHQLNKSAYAIGQIITHENPKKRVTRETAEQALTDAALSIGLGDDEIEKTLESGIDSGMDNPREDDTADEPTQDTGQQLQATTGTDETEPDSRELDNTYIYTDGAMYACLWDKRKEKFYNLKLSNFGARVLADTITDDGAEVKRSYELQATVKERVHTFEIPARDFTSVEKWIDEHLGIASGAFIVPGQSTKAHFCNAIRDTSNAAEQHYYAHTGWRRINETWVYLHNGGCIGRVPEYTEYTSISQKSLVYSPTKQPVEPNHTSTEYTEYTEYTKKQEPFKVKLTGALVSYQIERSGMSMVDAVRASLLYLDLASDAITMPLYASLWRSLLPRVNYSVHITGQSGLGKTELVALLAQHFGRTMHANNLPASWEDTENSLEMKLFQIKDAIVVLDDFKPKGSQNEQGRLHSKADRVFRSVGNGSARGRLDSNLNQRPERKPRSLVISTGEDTPKGLSLRGRLVVLLMDESITTVGSPAAQRLKAVQELARAGVYETAMYGYIEWLAPRIDTIESNLQSLLEAERDSLHFQGHGRLNTNTANMLLGFKSFLQFAQDCQAITAEEAQTLLTRCINALQRVAETAVTENANNKPSEQYIRLVAAALSANAAHFITLDGGNPGTAYGWKRSERVTTNSAGEQVIDWTYNPCGDKIGVIDGDDIYLLPEPAYKVACTVGAGINDNLTTTHATLKKFLEQDKLLATTSMHLKDKPRITIRKRIEGKQESVLHFKKSVLFGSDEDENTGNNHPAQSLGGCITHSCTQCTQCTHDTAQQALQADSKNEKVSTLIENDKNLCTQLAEIVYSPDEKPVDIRQVGQLLTELQTTLEKRDRTGIKKFIWRDGITEPWPHLDRNEFVARVSAAIKSSDEKLIQAATVATLRTLGKYSERG